ncbi:MAG: hypothetical protein DMG76_00020 [Acidobacteria bacterium]|jgi:hypothetical protein|nr:MAG: hypothetical protein DMG76_00020 [Acidobacteriota bacterium]
MHVIRLLNEGIELMRSGSITLPRPEKELLITIRTGQYGWQAEATTGPPEKVDRARVSKLASDTYLSYWTG